MKWKKPAAFFICAALVLGLTACASSDTGSKYDYMNLSDTIAVIYDGQIKCTFNHGEATQNQIGLLMGGGGTDGK